jgi:hypothetical protein
MVMHDEMHAQLMKLKELPRSYSLDSYPLSFSPVILFPRSCATAFDIRDLKPSVVAEWLDPRRGGVRLR